jgi:hypothetical protein
MEGFSSIPFSIKSYKAFVVIKAVMLYLNFVLVPNAHKSIYSRMHALTVHFLLETNVQVDFVVLIIIPKTQTTRLNTELPMKIKEKRKSSQSEILMWCKD